MRKAGTITRADVVDRWWFDHPLLFALACSAVAFTIGVAAGLLLSRVA